MRNKILYALSNRSGPFNTPDFGGPQDFAPMVVSPEMASIRSALFLDRTDTDYYLQVYLSTLASYRDIEAVFGDDSQTYDLLSMSDVGTTVTGAHFASGSGNSGKFLNPTQVSLPVSINFTVSYVSASACQLVDLQRGIVRNATCQVSADGSMAITWPPEFPFDGMMVLDQAWQPGAAFHITTVPGGFPYPALIQSLSSMPEVIKLMSEEDLLDALHGTLDPAEKLSLILLAVGMSNTAVYPPLAILGTSPPGIIPEEQFVPTPAEDLPPAAEFTYSPQQGAVPLAVQFTSTGTGTIDQWLWDFGDGHTADGPNPSHTFSGVQSYEVRLTVIGPMGTSSRVHTVVAGQALSAAFTMDVNDGVSPLTVHFTDTSVGVINSWDWDFGDSSMHSTMQNPSHTYTGTGPTTFTVTLTITGTFGTSSISHTVTLEHVVAAAFNYSPSSGNIPLTVNFTDESLGTISSWDWDFGDGGPHSSLQNPSHVFSSASTFAVKLTVTGPFGTDNITHDVTANPDIDPGTLDWYDRVIANGGTVSSTTLGYVDTLVTTLKSAGIFSDIGYCLIFCGNDGIAATTPLIKTTGSNDPASNYHFNLSLYSESTGMPPSGTNDNYFDCGLPIASMVASQNSCHLAIGLTNMSPSTAYSGGEFNASQTIGLAINYGGNTYFDSYARAGGGQFSGADSGTHGLWAGIVINSSSRAIYRGSGGTVTTIATAGSGPVSSIPTSPGLWCGRVDAASPSTPGNLCFFSCGSTLSLSDFTNLYNAVKALNASLGRTL